MMHEDSTVDFEVQRRRANRTHRGLTCWHAVHAFIAMGAAGVAVGTSYWLIPKPPGLLGIWSLGLWSVCYKVSEERARTTEWRQRTQRKQQQTDDTQRPQPMPELARVDDLKSYLASTLTQNLFASNSTDPPDVRGEKLSAELRELGIAAPSPSPAPAGDDGNATATAQAADPAESRVLADSINPAFQKQLGWTAAAQDAAARIVEGFPLSTGCTNGIETLAPGGKDSVRQFMTNVPYPVGTDVSIVFQCTRWLSVAFGVLVFVVFCGACIGAMVNGVGPAARAAAWASALASPLALLAGLGGTVAYFVLLARIATEDSRNVLNISYLFTDQQITFGVQNYWGWSGWLFIAAVGWFAIGIPIGCCVVSRAKAPGEGGGGGRAGMGMGMRTPGRLLPFRRRSSIDFEKSPAESNAPTATA